MESMLHVRFFGQQPLAIKTMEEGSSKGMSEQSGNIRSIDCGFSSHADREQEPDGDAGGGVRRAVERPRPLVRSGPEL